MTVPILLPKLGFTMSESRLTEWHVEDGGRAVEGQRLYSMESEKSVQEIESPATGTLRILAQAGEEYPIGHVLGEIS
jgi:pyruvate/2-oxoglutarate dehydrogenase complex dihydrolipoamide acyltransferase (E2) component